MASDMFYSKMSFDCDITFVVLIYLGPFKALCGAIFSGNSRFLAFLMKRAVRFEIIVSHTYYMNAHIY